MNLTGSIYPCIRHNQMHPNHGELEHLRCSDYVGHEQEYHSINGDAKKIVHDALNEMYIRGSNEIGVDARAFRDRDPDPLSELEFL